MPTKRTASATAPLPAATGRGAAVTKPRLTAPAWRRPMCLPAACTGRRSTSVTSRLMKTVANATSMSARSTKTASATAIRRCAPPTPGRDASQTKTRRHGNSIRVMPTSATPTSTSTKASISKSGSKAMACPRTTCSTCIPNRKALRRPATGRTATIATTTRSWSPSSARARPLPPPRWG